MSIIEVILIEKKHIILYKCDQCGKEYTGKYQKKFLTSRRHTYCSRECLWKSKTIEGIDYEFIQKSRDNDSCIKKMKETCLKKYGVENPYQSKEIREKIKQTWIKNHGVDNPMKSNKCQKKSKETCLKKYGKENPTQSKIIKEKVKETCRKRYGVDNPFQSEDKKEKSRKTCLKNHGVEHSMQSIDVKNKAKNTWIKKYDVDHPMKNEKIKKKCKLTWIQNYGDHPSKTVEFMNKRRLTNQTKYGVDHPLKSDIVKSKIDYKSLWKRSHETMKRNGTYGKSKIEDQFYKLLTEKFGEEDVERQVRINDWNIDFYIKSINTYIQFDGVYWHGLNRPIEVIKEFKNLRDEVIHKTYLRDQEQNVWFKKNNLYLVRVLDETFRNNAKEVEELFDSLT